eukprot:TRINITY_DN27471_c0_g1_i1.p1 TRINITY_DN27471_c0_g1~~TRINITY_DN27471_c0_g1_i1.p1  ORF type:complete len:555 (+),score=85.12 TRINITY_DN27471_c0_g1_i1:94-1665(+)
MSVVVATAAADDADTDAAMAGNVFPDISGPKELRRFELTACALQANSAHLRSALTSNRRPPGKAAAARGSDAMLLPLEAACQAGRLSSVSMLLKETVNVLPEVTGAQMLRPDRSVALAVDAGAADVIRMLVKSSAHVNALTRGQRPPLLSAIRHGHVEIVEALCAAANLDVNEVDARGSSALHEAVSRGNSNVLGTLLERKANACIANVRGWTPLHLAAHLGNLDAMARLLDAGANIDGLVDGTVAPAVVPAFFPSAPVAAMPVPTRPAVAGGGAIGLPGSDVCRVASAGGTDGERSVQVADAEDGAERDDRSKLGRRPAGGWAPLHLLLVRGNQDAIRQMVTWGADPCLFGGPDAVTPLMLAISHGHEAVALFLLGLKSVADHVDDQDRRGRCALHFAVGARSDSVVRGLLDVHASPTLRSDVGLSPIDAARSAGLPETCSVVKRLQIEDIVRLVMMRCRCRAQSKYEESEMLRSDLRLRGVSLDVQSERWSLPDGTWGFLSADRNRAQAQAGPTIMTGGFT